jgi:hypothetical protein
MNGMQRFLSILMGLAIAAFALPASAATKSISLTVPSGPLTASTTQINVTMNNTGNSNGNSFEIDWIPSANFSVQSGFIAGQPSSVGTLLNPGVYGSPYMGIVFNKQAPAKTSVTVTLNVTVTVTCASTPVTWKAAAWTGSPGPLSTTFTLTGEPYSTPIASLPNCISCNEDTNPEFPPVSGTGYFANMPVGTTVSDPGFAAGYRFKDPSKPAVPCNLAAYTLTNNITGEAGSTKTDGNGNTIPDDAAGLVWDESATPDGVIFVYMLTYKPEYVATAAEAAADPSLTAGLPKKKTKFCILNPSGTTVCSDPDKQAVLQACIGTAFSILSIPGDDPACLLNETWATLNRSQCPAWDPDDGPQPACVRATDTILEGTDPPIVRG